MIPSFHQWPMPVRIGAVALGGGLSIGTVLMMYPKLWWILLLGLLMVAGLLALFRWLLKWRTAKVGAPLDKFLTKKFREGVKRIRDAGKNLYSIPWYIVVGEPGSGKSELLRRCDVERPVNVPEPDPGGTIDMDWWFTNNAIIVDTAGSLVAEETPATTGKWTELCNLLLRTRPNCPFNGLLLVIPADSLKSDSGDQVKSKVGLIARRLDSMQRTLDLRFPVYVVITKCDLIEGFREFFADLDDPERQHQILGWSNPADLDEPFVPEQVEAHLEEVRKQLERRRLDLLLNPVHTENPGARRADQVDALYDFPEALTRLGPRLRAYLKSIFVVGPFSAKPLFFRGIYFTSALEHGAVLDDILAGALGVPVESIKDDKPWNDKRALFLRDLFEKKVFVEVGLVTRVLNTGWLKVRRRAALLSAAIVAVLVLMGLTWWGSHAFQQIVGRQSGTWSRLDVVMHRPPTPTIVGEHREGEGTYAYLGTHQSQVPDSANSLTIAKLPSRTLELAKSAIDVPVVFRPATRWESNLLNADRWQAHETALRKIVLKPLVDAAVDRLNRKGNQQDAANALAQLLRLETLSHGLTPVRNGSGALIDIDPLLKVVLEVRDDETEGYRKQLETDTSELNRVIAETYQAPWKDKREAAEALLKNLPLPMNDLVPDVLNSLAKGSDGGDWAKIVQLDNAMAAFDEAENTLLDTAPPSSADEKAVKNVWHERLKAVVTAEIELNRAREAIKNYDLDRNPGDVFTQSLQNRDAAFDTLLAQLPGQGMASRRQQIEDARGSASRDERKINFVNKWKALAARAGGTETDRLFAVRVKAYQEAEQALRAENRYSFAKLNERLGEIQTLLDIKGPLPEETSVRFSNARKMCRSIIVASALDAVADMDDLASAVSGAAGQTVWQTPPVPLTSGLSGQTQYNQQYNPDVVAGLFEGWDEITKELHSGVADKIQRFEQDARNPYVKSYLAYWSQEVPEMATLVSFDNWETFHDEISSLNVADIQSGLDQLADDAEDAISKLPPNLADDEKKSTAVNRARAGLAIADKSAYATRVKLAVEKWIDLGESLDTRWFRDLKPDIFKEHYLQGVYDESNPRVRFWSDLCLEATRLACDASVAETKDAIERLDVLRSRLPLSKKGQNPLTQDERTEARSIIDLLSAARPGADGTVSQTIGSGVTNIFPKIDEQLRKLAGRDGVPPNLKELANIARALDPEPKNITYELLRNTDYGQEHDAVLRYYYFQFPDKPKKDGIDSIGHAFQVSQENSAVKFFRSEGKVEPDATLRLPLPWAAIDYILRPGVRYSDDAKGQIWIVPLSVEEADGKEYWLSLGIRFPGIVLPSPAEWPP